MNRRRELTQCQSIASVRAGTITHILTAETVKAAY